MKRLLNLAGLLLVIFFPVTLPAQQQIQVIPTLSPSHNVLLSDYYTGRQEALSVVLINRDPQQPMLQAYLRITIEGQNVRLRTGGLSMYLAVDLMQGASVQLGAAELAPYFKPLYLQGSIGFGVNQPNVFPEGYYQFCVEVLEKSTNRLLGSMECGQASISLSEAPELVYPSLGKTISSGLPLLFQWSPQHVHSLNSEYTFTLVELETQQGKVTSELFAKSKVMLETTVYTTSFPYGADLPQLLPEKRYAWRVKVKARSDFEEEEPIANEGFSEIYWFKVK